MQAQSNFPLKYKHFLVLFFSFFIITTVFSQESINASSATVSNETGSVSYSVGQVFMQSYTNEQGMINEGIQLPFEIRV